MRVTFDLIRDGLSSINTAASQFAEAQRQVSSGKRTTLASDDPAATLRAIGEHADLSSIDALTRSGDAASARLTAADSVTGDVIDKLTAAISQATGARGTTSDQSARDAIADSLTGLRDAVLSDVNTTYQGGQLFSGSAVDQPTYVQIAGTWTYQGNTAGVHIQVDSGRQVAQTWNGQALAQGSDAQDVFTTFDNLIAAVRAGDGAAIGTGIDALQRAFTRATTLQSSLGADENSVSAAKSQLTNLRTATDARRSKDEDTNLAEAVTKMTQAQQAYQAALGAVGTAGKVSLLNYLQ